MGPVMVGGAYYVLAKTPSAGVALASVAVGLLVAAILHANNIRDVELDRRAGKITLATLLGRRWANFEYLALVAGAYLAVIAVVVWDRRFWPVLLVALTLPTAVRLARLVFSAAEGRLLNVALRKTAGLHLRFGCLLTVGLVIHALIDRV